MFVAMAVTAACWLAVLPRIEATICCGVSALPSASVVEKPTLPSTWPTMESDTPRMAAIAASRSDFAASMASRIICREASVTEPVAASTPTATPLERSSPTRAVSLDGDCDSAASRIAASACAMRRIPAACTGLVCDSSPTGMPRARSAPRSWPAFVAAAAASMATCLARAFAGSDQMPCSPSQFSRS